ncbi:MAG: hypothetical protein LBM27_05145 [Lactobacillaceae bacterium]|nr:hypothetical protein [Lactobacillaceae bacterium]
MSTIIEKTPVRFGDWGKNTALRLPKSIANKFVKDNNVDYDLSLIREDNGKLSITIELPDTDNDSKFISDDAFLAGFESIIEKYDDTFQSLVDM